MSSLLLAACTNTATKNSLNDTTGTEKVVKMKVSKTAISGLVTNYIAMKNALVADNDKDAASAGQEMTKAFDSFDKTSLTSEQAKVYNEIAVDAREHAEHIGANAGNIAHQREHFDTLSQDMYDLVKSVGAGTKLYVTNCPMYNKNKGANWLSETKEVQNPYFGQSMAKCGSVKEELI